MFPGAEVDALGVFLAFFFSGGCIPGFVTKHTSECWLYCRIIAGAVAELSGGWYSYRVGAGAVTEPEGAGTSAEL